MGKLQEDEPFKKVIALYKCFLIVAGKFNLLLTCSQTIYTLSDIILQSNILYAVLSV